MSAQTPNEATSTECPHRVTVSHHHLAVRLAAAFALAFLAIGCTSIVDVCHDLCEDTLCDSDLECVRSNCEDQAADFETRGCAEEYEAALYCLSDAVAAADDYCTERLPTGTCAPEFGAFEACLSR